VFGAAFAGLYLDGIMHRLTRTDANNGDVTVTYVDEPVKVQKDAVTERMKGFERYTARSVRMIILQVGPDGVVARPNSDAEVSVGGERWALSDVESDPANTYWQCLANPA
jgi:hypothetical protein